MSFQIDLIYETLNYWIIYLPCRLIVHVVLLPLSKTTTLVAAAMFKRSMLLNQTNRNRLPRRRTAWSCSSVAVVHHHSVKTDLTYSLWIPRWWRGSIRSYKRQRMRVVFQFFHWQWKNIVLIGKNLIRSIRPFYCII